MIALDNALVALQDITEIAVEQTQSAQQLVVEVSGKMASIDASLSSAITQLFDTLRTIDLFDVSGTANAIELTSADDNNVITALKEYQRLHFIASATNTAAATVAVDGLDAVAIANILNANQIFNGALVTLVYRQGAFYVTEQINPQTGHDVSDIGKLIIDTTDVLSSGEVAFDGSPLSRTTHPIAWAKISATINLIDQATKDADPITYGGHYGDGDGTTTFTLPILGGEFIRMFDDGRGVDDGRGFGSWQEDAIRNITGAASFGDNVNNSGALVHNTSGAMYGSNNNGVWYQDYNSSSASGNNAQKLNFDASLIVPTADEARPRSIAYYAKTRL